MKNVILILVLLITTSLFAQDKSTKPGMIEVDQSRGWMTKIAADPEMRGQMMDMIIEETKGNNAEMIKLINSMFSDPGMNKMISAKISERSEKAEYTLEARGIDKKDSKVKLMQLAKPASKKRLK